MLIWIAGTLFVCVAFSALLYWPVFITEDNKILYLSSLQIWWLAQQCDKVVIAEGLFISLWQYFVSEQNILDPSPESKVPYFYLFLIQMRCMCDQ